MSANLPAMPTVSLPAAAAAALRQADAPAQSELYDAINKAGSAAERADLHVQKWRTGMARMTLEVAMRDDPELDRAFDLIQRTAAWKILQEACLESPRIMAELRAYWKPGDVVEVRD